MTQKFECKFYLVVDKNGKFEVNLESEGAIDDLGCQDKVEMDIVDTYEIVLKVPGAKPRVIEAEIPEDDRAVPVEIAVKAE